MIEIKTPQDIEKMRKACRIAVSAMETVLNEVVEGKTTLELDQIVEEVIVSAGAYPGFKKVENYDFATCINVNSGIVHGIPSNYVLKQGDIVSIDLGAYIEGFHSDMAYTVEVGTNKEDDFLNTGRLALGNAINQCLPGNHLGDISSAIQQTVENSGYSVSKELVGHGLGREMHEDPQIPGYGESGRGPKLKEGMVFAIEVIYQKGKPDLILEEDSWTLKTADDSISGLFEHDVVITEFGPEVLTKFGSDLF